MSTSRRSAGQVSLSKTSLSRLRTMPKRKRGEQRPFRPEALDSYVTDKLRPRLVPGGRVWRYTVTVPVEQIRPTKKAKATAHDLNDLRRMLVRHFGGVTLL